MACNKKYIDNDGLLFKLMVDLYWKISNKFDNVLQVEDFTSKKWRSRVCLPVGLIRQGWFPVRAAHYLSDSLFNAVQRHIDLIG